MIQQMCLPLTGQTLCGYCGEPLAMQPRGYWACNECAPLLADIRTAEEWALFQLQRAR